MGENRFDDRAGQPILRFIDGHDREIARWVGDRLAIDDFGPCRAVGIIRGDRIIAGVVYNRFALPQNVEMTIASDGPGWCSAKVLRALFAFPFQGMGCRRVTAATEVSNEGVRAFLERLGFRQEGILRQWFSTGDAAVYGMMREECRWLGD